MKNALTVTMAMAIMTTMAIGQEKDFGRQRSDRPEGDRGGRRPSMQGERGGPGGEMEPGGRGGDKGPGGHKRGEMMERVLQNPELCEKLGLSEEDAKKMQNDLQKIEMEMIDLRAKMEKVGLRQARAMTDKEIDEGDLMDMVEEAGEIRTKMAKLQIKKMLLFRKNIDPQKMEQLRSKMKERMRERFQEGGRRPEGMREGRDGDQQRRSKMQEMRSRRHKKESAEGETQEEVQE